MRSARWRILALFTLLACGRADVGECDGAPSCRDGSIDGALDARIADAAHMPDAAALDAVAPVDATEDPPLPEITWTRLPDLPEGCEVERAAAPGAIPPLEWENCGTGCRRASLGSRWAPGRAFFRDGAGWITLVSDDFGSPREVLTLAPVDGPPIAAWRFLAPPGVTPRCRVRLPAVNDGWAGMVVNFVADDAATLIEDRVYSAPLDAIGMVDAATVVLGTEWVGSTRRVDQLAVAAEALATAISGGTVTVSRSGSTVAAFTATASAAAYHVAVDRDHLIFAETVGEWRLMHWTPETGTAPYYDPADDIGEPLLDGGVLVWIRYADFVAGRATRAELWSSPFVRDPSDLAPRLVHDRVEPESAVFADGTYAWLAGAEPRLVDVATGAESTLVLPAGVGCDALLYASSTDVLLVCVASDLAGPALYRLDPRVHATPAAAP